MSRRSLHFLTAAAALCVLSAAPTSHAKPFVASNSWEVALQLGGLWFLDSAAVPFDTKAPGFSPALSDTFAYTLSGTYNFTSHLGLDLALQLSPAEVNRLTIFTTHLDLVWHPIRHDWVVPFLGLGPSFSVLMPQGPTATDLDPGVNAVAGVKLYPWNHIGFRLDVRYLARIPTQGTAADGRKEVLGHDLIASVGLMGVWGGKEAPKAPIVIDTDGDGIPDLADKCPTEAGPEATGGCPDRDGDSIADAEDRCPDQAGTVEHKGCPDRDGDSLVDLDDACPDQAGPVALQGCPDRDGDGIADKDDKCPTIAGEAAHGGCPPPPSEEIVKKFTGVMKGITFQLNKDVIRPASFATLDEAAKVMTDFPQLRLVIEGHTSAEGKREHNIDLSTRRANSVRQYLVEHGVDAARIDTVGYGPDRPIAKNNTEANRAKNRRIEFKILQPE